jgi:hypothetical protein
MDRHLCVVCRLFEFRVRRLTAMRLMILTRRVIYSIMGLVWAMVDLFLNVKLMFCTWTTVTFVQKSADVSISSTILSLLNSFVCEFWCNVHSVTLDVTCLVHMNSTGCSHSRLDTESESISNIRIVAMVRISISHMWNNLLVVFADSILFFNTLISFLVDNLVSSLSA